MVKTEHSKIKLIQNINKNDIGKSMVLK